MSRRKSAPTVRANGKTAADNNADNKKANKTTGQLRCDGEQLYFEPENRRYRIRGLADNHCPQRLQVNLLVERDELVYSDTLDLYRARARNAFIRAVASELYLEEETVKRDVGQLLLQLEQRQQRKRTTRLAASSPTASGYNTTVRGVQRPLRQRRFL